MSYAAIAFDLGAESGRAMLGILNEGKLELHEAHRFANSPQKLPDGWRWDITGLWGHLQEGLKRGIEMADQMNLNVKSIGVDTWGVDYGLIGRNGELLGLPFVYRDERNDPSMSRTVEAIGPDKLYEITGLQNMPFNTLFQLGAHKQSEPGLLAIATRMLHMPDLLHYFFSGHAVNEFSIASTSQLLDLRKQGHVWATDLIESLGIPTGYLKNAEVVNPGTVVGDIRTDLAKSLHVPTDIQVITPAGHDTACAFAAAPVTADQENWVCLSSGTWSLMGVELDQPVLTEAAREGGFTNEGGVNGTTRFLTNIMGLWLVQETRRAYEKRGEVYDYIQLTQMACEAESFRTIIDPSHGPFLNLGGMLEKIDRYAEATNQPKPETVGQYVRCCLESLALTYAHTLKQLTKVLEKDFEVIHLVGGGGKNELLDQMTADATGLPVIVGPYEATAAGNALIQMMGGGKIADLNALREVIRASFEPKRFEPVQDSAWSHAYDRYASLLKLEIKA